LLENIENKQISPARHLQTAWFCQIFCPPTLQFFFQSPPRDPCYEEKIYVLKNQLKTRENRQIWAETEPKFARLVFWSSAGGGAWLAAVPAATAAPFRCQRHARGHAQSRLFAVQQGNFIFGGLGVIGGDVFGRFCAVPSQISALRGE